ncbi:MAG TPA: hypothetical protein VLV29_05745 [Steroidobacteraceae bacterium]|nr:hypothetical protein [Steroidobacteraceae bacterium]
MRALLPLLFAGTLAVAQPNTAPPPDNGGLLVPEGYVLQVLGATDGRIAMPKGWFYTNAATPSGWQWTFSAEDPRAGAYETGLRIQMFMRVEQELKRSRESFATAFLEQRRKSAHVLRDCPIQDFGSFKRQCLEVLEVIGEPSGQKQFHILYTVMWLRDMDIVAVSTFGAPPEKWDAVADITKVMSEFILIGKNPGNSN